MDAETYYRQIRRANHHRGGLKCLKLFTIAPEFLEGLAREVRRLVEAHVPSEVENSEHATNWTKPFGQAVQYSLLNRSGILDDFSTDHDGSVRMKRFHYGDRFPCLRAFIQTFRHATNMRLNGMGNASGLSPHEEHTVLYSDEGTACLRARFHLPIVTNQGAEMLLDGDLYRFEAGSVYYFNNGCVHSARNRGDEFRYHLVWDMLFTEETFDLMFSEDELGASAFLERCIGRDRNCVPTGREQIRDYEISGKGKVLYESLGLSRLGIGGSTFHDIYNGVEYMSRSRHRFAFSDARCPPRF